MNIRKLIVLIVFLLINAGIFYLLFSKPNTEDTEEKISINVQFFEGLIANNTTHFNPIKSYGIISASMSFDLSSEVQGKFLQGDVVFKPGVKFKKGEILCKIDNKEALYSLSARKSSFITLIANALPDIRIDFPDEFKKWENYMLNITLNRPIPNLPEWESNKEKVFLASRNIIAEYFGIKSNEETISKYLIIAPFNGMFLNTFANIHSNVNPGVRLATIIQTNNFEMKVPFKLKDMKLVLKGNKGKVFDNDGNAIASAIVDRISDVVNQNTQSVDVFFKIIPFDKEYLYEGMYANINLETDSIHNSCEIPRRALFNENYVYLYKDSSLASHPVTVERVEVNSYIVSGINQGDTVITSRVEKLIDTLKVGVIIP